jgi:hypothetical protein
MFSTFFSQFRTNGIKSWNFVLVALTEFLFFFSHFAFELTNQKFEMESTVSKAILEEDFGSLEESIQKGFQINNKYEYPIGCVSLFHDL